VAVHTSELAHAAFDGADATLLAVWPQVTVEALRLVQFYYQDKAKGELG
jgi:hypothetical protein